MQDYSSSFTAGVGPSSSSPTPSYHSPALPPSHLPNPDHSFLSSSMYSPRVLSYMGGAHMPAPLFTPQSPSPPTSMWQGGGGGASGTEVGSVGGAGGQEGGQTSPYSRLQSANNTGNYFSRYVLLLSIKLPFGG